LKSSLRKFYGLGSGISVLQMAADMFQLSYALPGPFFIHDLPTGL